MSIYVEKVKAQVTIQDVGRIGFQSSGVPISGAMDHISFEYSNLLVGNSTREACLEVGTGSLEMVIDKNSIFSVCGNSHRLFVNDVEAPQNRPILLHEKSNIKLRPGPTGLWSYVALGGGIVCPLILGSRSTYLQSRFGGLDGRGLMAGDVVETKETKSIITEAICRSLSHAERGFAFPGWSIGQYFGQGNFIRIMRGPEWNCLSDAQQAKLLAAKFTISSDSNRMGYRLKGKLISRKNSDEMISSGVTKGTIQLTNDGSLIVLMADSQTVGGYPRVVQVASVDIPKFSQQRPGAAVQFDLISHEQGERLFLENEFELMKVAASIRLKVL